MNANWLGILAVVAGFTGSVRAEDWPEWRGEGRRGVWNQNGVLQEFPGKKLEPVWTAPVGAGYNGPTVAGEGVYVMDRVRQDGIEMERVLCFHRRTGEPQWKHAYPCEYRDVSYPLGPRASVTVDADRTYAVGTMGHMHCLDAATGELIWAIDFGSDYDSRIPIWGITCSPLVEGDVVVVQAGGAEGACVLGLHKDTGEELWRAFDDRASYVSPILIEQAGKRVVVVWTGERIAGVHAATGEVYWELSLPPVRMPINVPGPALNEDGTRMFLSTFYDGSRVLAVSQEDLSVKLLWERRGINERKTEALHNMISPPYIDEGHVYGVDSYGQLRCLNLETGERIWESVDEAVPTGRWATIFMVRNGERTWMFNERGELILARLTPAGYEEIDRARLLEPTTFLRQRGGNVVWSHPAFAGTRVFARNDRKLVCVDLAAR